VLHPACEDAGSEGDPAQTNFGDETITDEAPGFANVRDLDGIPAGVAPGAEFGTQLQETAKARTAAELVHAENRGIEAEKRFDSIRRHWPWNLPNESFQVVHGNNICKLGLTSSEK
jgi:hypothetical protein